MLDLSIVGAIGAGATPVVGGVAVYFLKRWVQSVDATLKELVSWHQTCLVHDAKVDLRLEALEKLEKDDG